MNISAAPVVSSLCTAVTRHSNLADKMQTTLNVLKSTTKRKRNNFHPWCLHSVCVCRTKPGKKNDVEAVETRSELHIVTRVESAQNIEKMQFKIHKTCLIKKKKAPEIDFLFFPISCKVAFI